MDVEAIDERTKLKPQSCRSSWSQKCLVRQLIAVRLIAIEWIFEHKRGIETRKETATEELTNEAPSKWNQYKTILRVLTARLGLGSASQPDKTKGRNCPGFVASSMATIAHLTWSFLSDGDVSFQRSKTLQYLCIFFSCILVASVVVLLLGLSMLDSFRFIIFSLFLFFASAATMCTRRGLMQQSWAA